MNYSTDLNRALLWQYGEADSLKSLIESKNARHNALVNGFIQDWYRDVFNVDTANAFGLAVWARIFNLRFDFGTPPVLGKVAFGVGPNRMNFHPPSNFGAREGEVIVVTVEQQRLLIKLAAFRSRMLPTVDAINDFLLSMFGKVGGLQAVFVSDPMDMSEVTYTFRAGYPETARILIDYQDALPRPAGVPVVVVEL